MYELIFLRFNSFPSKCQIFLKRAASTERLGLHGKLPEAQEARVSFQALVVGFFLTIQGMWESCSTQDRPSMYHGKEEGLMGVASYVCENPGNPALGYD